MRPFLDETAPGQGESHTYQLFSVMIHSGSALGGHYYAYIWSFEKERWLCFNDSSVTWVGPDGLAFFSLILSPSFFHVILLVLFQIAAQYYCSFELAYRLRTSVIGDQLSDDQLEKAFGGVQSSYYSSYTSSYSSAYSSSASAYMLMYRRVDPARNALPLAGDTLPPHISNLVGDIAEEESKKARELEVKRRQLELEIYWTKDERDVPRSKELAIDKMATLATTTQQAWKLWKLEEQGVALVDVRLRKYIQYNNQLGETFAGREDKALYDLNLYSRCCLLLEKREPGEEFIDFNPNGEFTACHRSCREPLTPAAAVFPFLYLSLIEMMLHIIVYDPVRQSFRPSFRVQLDRTALVKDLKELVSQKSKIPTATMRLCEEPFAHQKCKMMDRDEASLSYVYFIRGGEKVSDQPQLPHLSCAAMFFADRPFFYRMG